MPYPGPVLAYRLSLFFSINNFAGLVECTQESIFQDTLRSAKVDLSTQCIRKILLEAIQKKETTNSKNPLANGNAWVFWVYTQLAAPAPPRLSDIDSMVV
jgi:hypothetical protein